MRGSAHAAAQTAGAHKKWCEAHRVRGHLPGQTARSLHATSCECSRWHCLGAHRTKAARTRLQHARERIWRCDFAAMCTSPNCVAWAFTPMRSSELNALRHSDRTHPARFMFAHDPEHCVVCSRALQVVGLLCTSTTGHATAALACSSSDRAQSGTQRVSAQSRQLSTPTYGSAFRPCTGWLDADKIEAEESYAQYPACEADLQSTNREGALLLCLLRLDCAAREFFGCSAALSAAASSQLGTHQWHRWRARRHPSVRCVRLRAASLQEERALRWMAPVWWPFS